MKYVYVAFSHLSVALNTLASGPQGYTLCATLYENALFWGVVLFGLQVVT